jgi:hypothetical protein
VPDVTQRTVIEDTLRAIDERLRSTAPSPAVRELRVRHGSLHRVVRGWLHVPPHDAQVAAMLECVLELRGQVFRACPAAPGTDVPPARRSTRPVPRAPAAARASASQARTTRPPPRRDASMRTTRPPPLPRGSDVPPSSRRG